MVASSLFRLCFLILLPTINNGANSRERYSMNFDWLFHLGSEDLQHASCTLSPFQVTPNKVCQGLNVMTIVAKNDINGCANACYAFPTCAYFQISSGICSVGGLRSIHQPFSDASTCSTNSSSTFYSRSNNVPDTNPDHFVAATKNYDDSSWNKINLPHDFIVNGTFTSSAQRSNGYLPKNTSWYRKKFSLPSAYMNDTTLWIDFDGIFRDSVIFINGHFLGNHSSGYTSFRYFLDPVSDELQFGDHSENVLTVFVDATGDEGWWYEGGGIYRNVFFNKANKIYFEPWGIYLPAMVTNINSDGVHGNGKLIINATINNKYNTDYTVNLQFDIINPDGSILKTLSVNNTAIKANSDIVVAPAYVAENVILWSLENPALYAVNCRIYNAVNGEEIDFISLRYGYRKTVFDPQNGLLLNDKAVKMKGFCNHQDFGGTGIATPERINRFRVQHLKKMGANSWRMSHNPPNPELLSFADEYGFLIWDENRHFGDSQQWFKDQGDMILRDRNHPSIVIWSICNEAGCQQGSPSTTNITLMFKDIIQRYDGVYAGGNSWGYNRPISGAGTSSAKTNYQTPYLDIVGNNYGYPNLANFHNRYPNRSVIESESCSCTTDRNEYVSSASSGHCSAYTDCITKCWIPIATQDFVIGSFDWTGFDYKGEPSPYNWPDINSHFGVNDMVGFPKDDYWYYRAMWTDTKDEIILYILPNTWNNDTKTNPINVRVYTNCKLIELFVNNKSVSGKQTVTPNQYYAINVTYEYGSLSCICYDSNNNILQTSTLQTTNAPSTVRLEWEYPYNANNTIYGDGQDVALINVFVVDDENRIVPNATNLVTFSIDNEELAFILGTGNGDPANHEPDQSNFRSVYHGKARILIQSMLNTNGKVTLTAKSNGLTAGTIQINIQAPTRKVLTL